MAAGGKDVGLGGGQIVRQLLGAGLLDELQLQLVPVLLGGGVRLFEGLAPDAAELQCTEAVESHGIAHLRFRVLR